MKIVERENPGSRSAVVCLERVRRMVTNWSSLHPRRRLHYGPAEVDIPSAVGITVPRSPSSSPPFYYAVLTQRLL